MITFFGIIWSSIIIVCFFIKNIKYMIFTLLFSMILQSDNVLIIGGVGIGPHIITSCAFIVKSFFYRNLGPCKNHTLFLIFSGILLLLSIYILFNGLFINKYSTWTNALMMVVYLFCALRLYSVSTLIDFDFINSIVDFLSVFILIIGSIVCLQKINIIPSIGIFKILFFNDDLSGIVAYNDTINTYRFYATFMEPSYCACFLTGAIMYYLCLGKKELKTILLVLALSLALLLTMSSTGYVCFGLSILIFFFAKTYKQSFNLILPLGIIACLFMIIFFPNVLYEVTFGKFLTSSGKTRRQWDLWALESFYNAPLFGVGFSNQRANSLFYTLLGELGIIGITIYSTILLLILFVLFFKDENNIEKPYVFFTLAVIIGQIIACPDLHFCVFWFASYIWALGTGANNIRFQQSKIIDYISENNSNKEFL